MSERKCKCTLGELQWSSLHTQTLKFETSTYQQNRCTTSLKAQGGADTPLCYCTTGTTQYRSLCN